MSIPSPAESDQWAPSTLLLPDSKGGFFVDPNALNGVGAQLKSAVTDPKILGGLPAADTLSVSQDWLGNYGAAIGLRNTCVAASEAAPNSWTDVRTVFRDAGSGLQYAAANYAKVEQGITDSATRAVKGNAEDEKLMRDLGIGDP